MLKVCMTAVYEVKIKIIYLPTLFLLLPEEYNCPEA